MSRALRRPALSLDDVSPVTHKIYTEDEDDSGRAYWECSCGHSGSSPGHRVDLASDTHINYRHGDRRVDTNRPL